MKGLYVKQLRYQAPDQPDSHPFDLAFLKQLNEVTFATAVTFIVGENGVGKSTLIETIAQLMDLNLEGGSRNNQFSSYGENQLLADNCRLIRYPNYPKDAYFYRAETYYNLMTNLDDLGISAELFAKNSHHYSRGQSFKELVSQRFFGKGLYIMDEPETGLSISSQFELLVMMGDLVKRESQFIVATHSPALLMFPGATIFELSTEGLKEVTYQETQLFKEWQMLFERQSVFVEDLLRE